MRSASATLCCAAAAVRATSSLRDRVADLPAAAQQILDQLKTDLAIA